jgi:hypothetical protein
MKNRPITTLFMLSSVDGKISTVASDELDVDSDFPMIDGVRQGLHQYYEIEKTIGRNYITWILRTRRKWKTEGLCSMNRINIIALGVRDMARSVKFTNKTRHCRVCTLY